MAKESTKGRTIFDLSCGVVGRAFIHLFGGVGWAALRYRDSRGILLGVLVDGVPRSCRELVRLSGLGFRQVENALFRCWCGGLVLRTASAIYEFAAIATNKKRMLLRPAVLDPILFRVSSRNTDLLDPFYFFRYLQSIDLTLLQSGTSVPQVNKDDLMKLLITYPPIEKQKQIVVYLDKLTGKIEILAEIRARAQAYPLIETSLKIN